MSTLLSMGYIPLAPIALRDLNGHVTDAMQERYEKELEEWHAALDVALHPDGRRSI